MKASQPPTDLEVAISMLDFLQEQFAKGFVVKATYLSDIEKGNRSAPQVVTDMYEELFLPAGVIVSAFAFKDAMERGTHSKEVCEQVTKDTLEKLNLTKPTQ